MMTKSTAVFLPVALVLLGVCVVLMRQSQHNRDTLAAQRLWLAELQRSLPSFAPLQPRKSPAVPLSELDTAESDSLQTDPSYRNGIQLQAEVNARHGSGDFRSWAAIPSGAFEKLVALLAKQEVELHDQADSALLAGNEAQVRNEALRKRHEAQIQELLGPAHYQSWREWQDNEGSRQWARNMDERLRPEDSVSPEKARLIVAALRKVELEIRSEPRDPAESGVEYARRAHRRIHSVMASQLSPVQLKQFELLQKEKLEAMEALAQMAEKEKNARLVAQEKNRDEH